MGDHRRGDRGAIFASLRTEAQLLRVSCRSPCTARNRRSSRARTARRGDAIQSAARLSRDRVAYARAAHRRPAPARQIGAPRASRHADRRSGPHPRDLVRAAAQLHGVHVRAHAPIASKPQAASRDTRPSVNAPDLRWAATSRAGSARSRGWMGDRDGEHSCARMCCATTRSHAASTDAPLGSHRCSTCCKMLHAQARGRTLRRLRARPAMCRPSGVRHAGRCRPGRRDRGRLGHVRPPAGRRSQAMASVRRQSRGDRDAPRQRARVRGAAARRARTHLPLARWPAVGVLGATADPRPAVPSTQRRRRDLPAVHRGALCPLPRPPDPRQLGRHEVHGSRCAME